MKAHLEAKRRFFSAGGTRSTAYRREQLEKLRGLLREKQPDITEALRADLGKPVFEAYLSEVGFCLSEVNHAIEHLEGWMEEQPVTTPLSLFPARSSILREPKGVVLIIAPWNYPFQLVVAPFIAALAAGNCAVLKPSELAPETATLVERLVSQNFSEELVSVVTGEADVAKALLEEKFDHIFYTGGASVGRSVMKAAAENLTPVTLELGGKSPCLVDEDVRLPLAARRIAWGKFWNAGQSCIAPDYVLVSSKRAAELVAEIQASVRRFFGEEPQDSPDYARIVNERHFARLSAYLGEGRIAFGGQTDREGLYVAPTALVDVPERASVLDEEIFGPILPIVPYESLDEAIRLVGRHPDPLALYVFSRRPDTVERVLREVPSGGVSVNDTLIHFSSSTLPFGGRGASGTGRYHGRFGFETFSHQRAVVRGATLFDPPLRYPPYGSKLRWVKRLLG